MRGCIKELIMPIENNKKYEVYYNGELLGYTNNIEIEITFTEPITSLFMQKPRPGLLLEGKKMVKKGRLFD
jgi:hypothetical protein